MTTMRGALHRDHTLQGSTVKEATHAAEYALAPPDQLTAKILIEPYLHRYTLADVPPDGHIRMGDVCSTITGATSQ